MVHPPYDSFFLSLSMMTYVITIKKSRTIVMKLETTEFRYCAFGNLKMLKVLRAFISNLRFIIYKSKVKIKKLKRE
jgi:hypothetical protein